MDNYIVVSQMCRGRENDAEVLEMFRNKNNLTCTSLDELNVVSIEYLPKVYAQVCHLPCFVNSN